METQYIWVYTLMLIAKLYGFSQTDKSYMHQVFKMGKSKKNSKLGGAKISRNGPLGEQIDRAELAKPTQRIKVRGQRKDDDEEYVDGLMGHNILKQSLAQLQEISNEAEENSGPLGKTAPVQKQRTPVSLDSAKDNVSSDDEDGSEVDETENAVPQNIDKVVKDFEEELKLEDNDRKALEHFMNKDAAPQRRLADMFRDKITEKQTEIKTQIDADSVNTVDLSPEVQEMCKEVGKILAKYRAGALPKMFKIIPKMRSWEELVYMTGVAMAMAAAAEQQTWGYIPESLAERICVISVLRRTDGEIRLSNYNFNIYLQERCHNLLLQTRIRTAVFLIICISGTCTLREAIIIGSVIGKNHIPILHSAAAILKIAEMDYNGANSIFLRIFFDKKYALPFRVVDACVYHFIKFRHDKRDLPVLWHQSLLAFVQRYKEDLSPDQKEEILETIKFHGHFQITTEVRRELANSKCRDEAAEDMTID
ncbi:unnamed protein product, partial [Meganyctiphanes norvegica]